MERRYLAASLAVVATFTMFSHAFKSGHLAPLLARRTTLVSDLKCVAGELSSRLMEKVNPSLRRNDPEEVQLLAEMNLPQVAAQAQADAALARLNAAQALAVAKANEMQVKARAVQSKLVIDRQDTDCPQAERARELAERKAERAAELAERQIEQAQAKLEREHSRMAAHQVDNMNIVVEPINFKFSMPRNMGQQLRVTSTIMQNRMTNEAMQLQVAAKALQHAQMQLANIKVEDFKFVVPAIQAVAAPATPACKAPQPKSTPRHL